MKRNREQTRRLILFWAASLLFVLVSVAASTISASFSAVSHARYAAADTIIELVELRLQRDPNAEQLNDWLPDVLTRFDAQQLRLTNAEEALLTWRNDFVYLGPQAIFERQLAGGYQLTMSIPAPSLFNLFAWQEWLLLISGVLASLLAVGVGHRWLVRELRGVEELAYLANRINNGDHHAAGENLKGLRPLSVARAFNILHGLWRDERRAKLELDKQIRTNVFVDHQTGLGNRLFFERHLLALSQQQQIKSNAVIYLLQFEGLDRVDHRQRLELLRQFVDLTQPLLKDLGKQVFARLQRLQLGLMITGLTLKEAESLAEKLQRLANRLHLPDKADPEHLLDIGVNYFRRGENIDQVIEEAELALRAAQLQGHSNWFIYEKAAIDQQLEQGMVRWRSIIESALRQQRIQATYQGIYNDQQQLVKREQFNELLDAQGNILPASLYLPMAQRCGLRPRIERDLLALALKQMQQQGWDQQVVVNVSAESVLHPRFGKSVGMLLANYQVRRAQLVVEVNERELVREGAAMAKVLSELKRIGVQLAVDGVGYTVEHTQYIDEFSVDWLKLHPSLVRDIHLRPENQLVITSLLQSTNHRPLQLIAEGVEQQQEWQTLLELGVTLGQGSFFNQLKDDS
ncbi:EAL domain-containing protein [Ferrimonas senticii]|uniref:EAL domain-containing protein n=1 Tax=Ferrimonas senticii TaxID=394566 RepID=UPI000419C9A3|nr:EAL domain-containing protein [Ferrimonas senticii]